MGADKESLVRYEAKLARALEAVDDRAVCLVGPRHRGPMVRGHIVPRSRLRLIAESCDSRKEAVQTFDMGFHTLGGRAAGAFDPVHVEPQPSLVSIRSKRLRRPFACCDHDNRLFEPIDGSGFDPENPQHRALVSYRTLLYIQYEALSSASASRRIESTQEFRSLPLPVQEEERAKGTRMRIEANSANRAKSALYLEAVERKTATFTHRAILVPGQTKVAFAGACARGGDTGWTPREREAAPAIAGGIRRAEPFVLACYPDQSGHIAVASCPRELADLLPVVFPAFGDACDDREALLSASALDMTEHIMIAPSAWDGYGDERQRRIWGRWARPPEGPRDALADPDVAPLNLFV